MPPRTQLLLHPKKRQRLLEPERDWIVDPDTGCWEWQNYRGVQGYARCTNGPAHREVWRQAGRPLADADHLHHRCENPGCVNPDHMEPKAPTLHLTEHKQDDSHLTWDDIHELRRLAKTAELTVYDIGERYGLGKSQVWNIIANLKWHDSSYTPGRPAVCDECGEDFVARRSNQRFCSKKHKDLWNGRRTGRRARGQNPDGSETRLYPKEAA